MDFKTMENFTNIMSSRYNALSGAIVTVLTAVLGDHWFLFVAFLMLNVIDMVTGNIKAKRRNAITSEESTNGAARKLWLWIMIMVAFLVSAILIEIGRTFGMNLAFCNMIGYFVLCSLIISEIRSIVENFVEAGYNVPPALTKGLQIADLMIKNKEAEQMPDATETEVKDE